MPQLYLNSDLAGHWAADGMPTVAHGASLTFVPDLSGNNRHMGNVSTAPTMNRTNKQGMPAFDFAGTGYLQASVPASSAWTHIVVAGRVRSTVVSNPRIFGMGGGTILSMPVETTTMAQGHYDISGYRVSGAYMGGDSVHISTIVAASNASADTFMDGVAVGTALDPSDFSATTTIQIGGQGPDLDGLVFEVLSYNVALTTAQRTAVERYLAQKYRIPYPGEAPISIAAGTTPLTAWYDFSDPSTLFTDSARTKPVATEGDSIIAVADKSPKGSHLASFVNGAGLVYKPNRFNGRGVLLTNADQYLSVSGLAAHATSTMFVVARRVGSQLGGPPGLAGHGSGCHLYDLGTSWGWRLNQAGGGPTICNGDPASLAVLVVRANSASSLDGYYNGGTPVNIDPHDEITTATTIVIGKNISGVAGVFEIGEFVRYNIAMTAAQINIVGAALATKWGTTWNTAS